jgi:PTH1 family peptidyl-tRNA hydrolase
VRIKSGGGHGGHNGLRSIIEHIGTPDFIRVRVGIGRPDPGRDAAEYVLGALRPEERALVSDAVERAAEAVKAIVFDGLIKAMNEFNKK